MSDNMKTTTFAIYPSTRERMKQDKDEESAKRGHNLTWDEYFNDLIDLKKSELEFPK